MIWTQCKPCIICYKQDSSYFDPKKSSTNRKQLRQSKACQSSQSSTYYDDKNFCKNVYSYGDGSTIADDHSWESFTFESTLGKPVILPSTSFGCGPLNKGMIIPWSHLHLKQLFFKELNNYSKQLFFNCG